MDARNAAESDQTKPAGASPRPERQPTPEAKSPRAAPAAASGSPDKAHGRRRDSSDAPGDRDSDAETIVLPGKDGHSPSKVRKVRQEDKSDGDADASKSGAKSTAGSKDSHSSKARKLADSARGRTSDSDKDAMSASKEDSTTGVLSSTRTSPSRSRQRRRSFSDGSSQSDGEKHAKTTLRDKFKAKERLLPHKRKASRPASDSEDEQSSNRVRRKRTASASMDVGRIPRERRASMSKSQHDARNQSTSPHRSHRRSTSTQLPSNGPAAKKRRPPPPLQTAGYHSDDSSAGSSPHPRNSKAKSLAASHGGESSASPAKVPSHKKHLDAHGQTLLARACARGEFEGAKKRLRDRPEDLNVADYAGNTPLQIAAINGCEDIVQLLIDAGCNLDCVNYDKETPLLDAVDNGHLGVVKLLLEAGVNPRKANLNGEEPIDRVTEETDNGEEIRTALVEAKKRFGGRTKTSEDRNSYLDNQETPGSPRQSPATIMASGRRSGTVRATKTRNDLLYQPLDDKALRQAAGRGDEEMVARIIQVKGSCQDAEPMVAAARGGHDLVIQLLLGLGGANPDPEPVSSQPPEFATPILAAIGQENIKVLELLLNQQSVDPTRRYKGETYYEIAKRRQGTNWKDEEQILKNAYDAYKSSRKPPKTKTSGRRELDKEREEKRIKSEASGDGRPHKQDPRSPSRDSESRKKMARLPSPKGKRRSDSQSRPGDDKGATARPRKDDKTSANTPDREDSPAVSHKHPKTKRPDSEVALSSEGEAVKPRRKLVSKGELREKRRRSSVTSATSGNKEPSSPRETKQDAPTEKEKATEKSSDKHADRPKGLRKEDSRDSTPGDSATAKRHRAALNSDRGHNGDKEDGGAPAKRRRVEGEDGDKHRKRVQSPADPPRKSASDPDHHGKPTAKKASESDKPKKTSSGGDVRIKSEDADVEMPDAGSSVTADAPEQGEQPSKKKKSTDSAKADSEAAKEQERKRAETEKKERQEEAAAKKAKEEEEAAKKKEAEEREAEKKRQEQAERAKREEEEKRQVEIKARQEAEEKARREEEDKKRLEEEKRVKEEEERKRREEEKERRRKEREAAEEARRKREEEERRERERRERAHREEVERKRAAREAEQRRIHEEQEKARLDKLPPLLRWLDTCPNPKNPAYAKMLRRMQGARYDTMRPETRGTPQGREEWVLNASVALILGEKDLNLTRCKLAPRGLKALGEACADMTACRHRLGTRAGIASGQGVALED